MNKNTPAYNVIGTLSADENTLARIETDILANDENALRFQSVDELFEELENDL